MRCARATSGCSIDDSTLLDCHNVVVALRHLVQVFFPASSCSFPVVSIPAALVSHCRMCGKVICANCSPHAVPVAGLDPATKHRVCHRCFQRAAKS